MKRNVLCESPIEKRALIGPTAPNHVAVRDLSGNRVSIIPNLRPWAESEPRSVHHPDSGEYCYICIAEVLAWIWIYKQSPNGSEAAFKGIYKRGTRHDSDIDRVRYVSYPSTFVSLTSHDRYFSHTPTWHHSLRNRFSCTSQPVNAMINRGC